MPAGNQAHKLADPTTKLCEKVRIPKRNSQKIIETTDVWLWRFAKRLGTQTFCCDVRRVSVNDQGTCNFIILWCRRKGFTLPQKLCSVPNLYLRSQTLVGTFLERCWEWRWLWLGTLFEEAVHLFMLKDSRIDRSNCHFLVKPAETSCIKARWSCPADERLSIHASSNGQVQFGNHTNQPQSFQKKSKHFQSSSSHVINFLRLGRKYSSKHSF